MNLSDEQTRFLRHNKINPDSVLDATRMTTGQYKLELKRQNKAVALVGNMCGKNHPLRLRLSSGHCMECSPQGVSHWLRRQYPGFVYIASSKKLGALKVGIAKVATDRADSLNRDGYGGATDWVILYRRRFDKSGFVEDEAHTALRQYERRVKYTRLGHGTEVETSELFTCEYAAAREVLERPDLVGLAQAAAWEPRR